MATVCTCNCRSNQSDKTQSKQGIVAGRLAVVTGAGSGIGRAVCQVLSREGATVIAADKNYDSALETIKLHVDMASESNEIGEHSAMEVDIANSQSVQKFLQAVLKKYKSPPTIIVNSAGITKDNMMFKMSESEFDAVINVNLKGTFLIMQAFSRAMSEASVKSGSIVNIASVMGKYGNMGQTNYSASKAGVEAMTRSAAKELAKFNIRVNSVLPGFIRTPITDVIPEKVADSLIKKISIGRIGEASEVAEVITFLSSDRSSYITGASIDVSGGF